MAETQKAPEVNESDQLQKLADAYAKDGTKKPGYGYRWVTTGGVTVVRVTKLGK